MKNGVKSYRMKKKKKKLQSYLRGFTLSACISIAGVSLFSSRDLLVSPWNDKSIFESECDNWQRSYEKSSAPIDRWLMLWCRTNDAMSKNWFFPPSASEVRRAKINFGLLFLASIFLLPLLLRHDDDDDDDDDSVLGQQQQQQQQHGGSKFAYQRDFFYTDAVVIKGVWER